MLQNNYRYCTKEYQMQTEKINIMRQEINDRVGVLEKWRHIILGGSIVVGFLLHKFLFHFPLDSLHFSV